MASIPLLSLSLSSIIGPSLTCPLSLVTSTQPPRTRAIPSSKSIRETWKHSRRSLAPSLTGKTRGGTDRSPDVPTADSRSDALLLLDAHRAYKAALGVRCLPRCALLKGMLATDDANIEGRYLIGWTWWLLAERKKRRGRRCYRRTGRGRARVGMVGYGEGRSGLFGHLSDGGWFLPPGLRFGLVGRSNGIDALRSLLAAHFLRSLRYTVT
jgi:hypothetical protein